MLLAVEAPARRAAAAGGAAPRVEGPGHQGGGRRAGGRPSGEGDAEPRHLDSPHPPAVPPDEGPVIVGPDERVRQVVEPSQERAERLERPAGAGAQERHQHLVAGGTGRGGGRRVVRARGERAANDHADAAARLVGGEADEERGRLLIEPRRQRGGLGRGDGDGRRGERGGEGGGARCGAASTVARLAPGLGRLLRLGRHLFDGVVLRLGGEVAVVVVLPEAVCAKQRLRNTRQGRVADA